MEDFENAFNFVWDGKNFHAEVPAELSQYHDTVAWFATCLDDEGNKYEARWDYIEPSYDCGNDLSDCADWEHPAEVIEL